MQIRPFIMTLLLPMAGCSSPSGKVSAKVSNRTKANATRLPTNAATLLSFKDTDALGGRIQGSLNISAASNESDITHYVVYWGSDTKTKQNATPLAALAAVGSDLTFQVKSDTDLPLDPSATHFLVFTKNETGEMPVGVSVPIVDLGLPVHAATSLAFTDTDSNGREVSGDVQIGKASDESDIRDYVLYWGSNATTKGSETPIATIETKGSNLTYNIPADTLVPTNPAATHLLVFTKNAGGQMAEGVSTLIVDKGVPTHAAVSVAFTDTDTDGGQLGGNVTITKAADESDVTDYVLYWGSSATVKQSTTPIAEIAQTGNNLSYAIAANTTIPSAPNATHLLVFTKNADGEMATGVSVAIVDDGVPSHAAVSASFTDTDTDGGQIAGAITITKASSEVDVTHYVLYWGSNTTTKQNATPIASVAVTGANLTYTLANNTAIPTGPSATHLLIFSKNASGEMATGIYVPIVDIGVPTNAATSVAFTDTDTDGGQVAGTVTITKASSELDLTHYVLYWGSNTTTKQNATAVTTIAVTGSNVTYSIPANTSIPSSPAATHLLVFTKNADGEMATGVNIAITDAGVPTNAATSISFTDTDLDGSELGGTVNITKASSEADVTHYVIYWGSNSTTKQNATAITTIATTGSNVTYSMPAGTAIPTGPTATHLLVFTKNADGEMATGVDVAITDVGVPTQAAASVAFTDTDTDTSKLGGTVSISKASSESDVTHYVLYWGSNSSTKQNATAITTIATTGSNVTYAMPAGTAIPTGPTATHLLVFTKNADGEMATGVNVAISDAAIPANAAASVAFTDTDTDASQLGGTVTITKASSEADVTHYVLYWGSNSTTKQNATAITTIAVTGSNVTYSMPANTAIPTGPTATHLLVFTKNASGEMATGVNVAISDAALPANAPASVAFTDTDTDASQLGGTVTITKASSEADVTHYVLYWGSNSSTKQNATAITTIAVTGSNVTYSMPANTAIPTGPTATHLLAFSKNASGEMATGVNVAISDAAIPANAAVSVAFTDTDTDASQLGGTVTITKASSEADVTHYVLYWGSNSTTKQNATAITTIAVTGSNVTYSMPANTAIPTGPTATHLLVFTKNANGEMATGVNVAISDAALPANAPASVAFTDTDTDASQLGGTVTITKASSEADVTHYVLYWGSNSSTKQNATAITTIAVTGSNVTYSMPANTAIPTGPTATHLLAFSKNASGEMATGVNVAITDSVPASCGGASVGGYCWYNSTDIDDTHSCTQRCAGLGGYNSATETFAGSGGTAANCKAVLIALGKITSGDSVVNPGGSGALGCWYEGFDGVAYLSVGGTPATTAAGAPSFGSMRACACNN